MKGNSNTALKGRPFAIGLTVFKVTSVAFFAPFAISSKSSTSIEPLWLFLNRSDAFLNISLSLADLGLSISLVLLTPSIFNNSFISDEPFIN